MYYQCQCSVPFLSRPNFSCFSDVCVWQVCIYLPTASNMSSKFTMPHPSICQSAMNVKDVKLGYILLVEYKNVYVSVYSSVKWMNSAFWGFRDNYVVCASVWQCHPPGKLSHPSKHCWIWNTKVILYDKSKLELRKCELNTINSLNDTLSNVFSWFFAQKPALLMVVCYLEALKNKRSSRTWLVHPSSSEPLIEAEFFWKNRKYISTSPGSSE